MEEATRERTGRAKERERSGRSTEVHEGRCGDGWSSWRCDVSRSAPRSPHRPAAMPLDARPSDKLYMVGILSFSDSTCPLGCTIHPIPSTGDTPRPPPHRPRRHQHDNPQRLRHRYLSARWMDSGQGCHRQRHKGDSREQRLSNGSSCATAPSLSQPTRSDGGPRLPPGTEVTGQEFLPAQ